MPKFGDLAQCQACGNEIKWIGQYWEHTTCNPRHVGRPKVVREPPANEMSPEFQEVLRNDVLVATMWQMGTTTEDMVVKMAERHAELMDQLVNASAFLGSRVPILSEPRLIGTPRGDEDG
jgi:hypothetical protein